MIWGRDILDNILKEELIATSRGSGLPSSAIFDGAGNVSTKGSPQNKVPINAHTVWSMSPIRNIYLV